MAQRGYIGSVNVHKTKIKLRPDLETAHNQFQLHAKHAYGEPTAVTSGERSTNLQLSLSRLYLDPPLLASCKGKRVGHDYDLLSKRRTPPMR